MTTKRTSSDTGRDVLWLIANATCMVLMAMMIGSSFTVYNPKTLALALIGFITNAIAVYLKAMNLFADAFDWGIAEGESRCGKRRESSHAD